MQNRIASQAQRNRVYNSIVPSIRSCIFLIATMALLYASTLCLAAGQAETAPRQTEVTARYLGTLESGSAVEANQANPPLAGPLAVTATTPAPAILSFNAAEIGVAAGSAQQLTASFSVSGYSGSFTPTATLHYGHDYTIGAVTCTPSGASETCNITVSFRPLLPGARKDAIFLMDGTTRLATVLLGGVGQGPLSLVQPGAFSTSVPTNNYLYQSVADENGIVYILPSGNSPYIERVTKAGVASQIALTNPPYFWTIGIDGAGVLYLFNETTTVTTYDTVQGIQGTYQIPSEPLGIDPTNEWFPGALGVDGSIYVVNQIRNNGVAYAVKPDGTTAYDVTLNPGVLQPFTAAVDSAGDFFVGGYEINKITPAGVQTQVNTVGASEGLTVDAADTLYATRYNPTDGVAELPASDYSTPIASFGRSSPLGMSLGSDGTLYVSNYVNLDIFDRSTTETLDFGEVTAGSSQTNSTASVYNGGNQPLMMSGYTLSELSDAGFSLDFSSANACNFNIVLAPGTLCQATVVFAPTHPGTFSGTISISSNSLNGNITQTIQLAGISYGSYDVLSPSPLVFAAQAPGTTKTLAVTMTNEGNSYASTIYSVATDNPAFTIAQGTCSGVAVQVGASCQLQVTFTPSAVQAYSGTATIVTYVSGTAQPFQTITLPLSGTGVGPVAATPVITPGTGSYTSSQQVTITDTTPNATIYYTTDGSVPSTGSAKYTVAIAVNTDETVSAIATAAGYTQSSTASATFTFHEAVATVTPTSLAFANQVQGTASVAQTVTLKNTGVGTLTLTGFPITGSAEFSQTNNCAGSLAAGSSCKLSIVFTPASLGDKTAALTINSDSIKAAPTVTLTGTGIAPPAPTFTPSTLAFGNQIVTTTSARLTTTLTNTGTDTLVIDGALPTIIGAGAASISAVSNCPATLAPAATCTVSASFTPSSVGAYSLSLQMMAHYSSAPSIEFTPAVALTGTGIAQPPVLKISPATLNFGDQIVDTSSAAKSVTVTNISKTDTVVVSSISSPSLAFYFQPSSCSSPIPPGMSCTIPLVFTPTAIEAYNSTDTVQVQPASCGGCVRSYPAQTFTVTGTGIAQPPVLAISPATLDFGNQIVNTTSTRLPVTVTNTSATDTIALTTFVINSPGFSVNFSSCPPPLAPGASCTVYYTFNPSTPQVYNAVASIQAVPYQCGGCVRSYSLGTFNLTGVGIAQPPVLAISPATLDFGNQIVNTTSARLPVTVTNTSATDTIALTTFVINSPGFSVNFSSCPPPLAPGASCTVYYTFNPSTPQVYNAVASIQAVPYQCGGCVRSYPLGTFNLTGTGVTPKASLTPASMSLTSTVGTTSAAQTATLTNTGVAPLTILGVSVSGTSPSDYSQTNNCGTLLAVGASCTISVTFTPAFPGSYPATLTVSDNDPNSPQTVSMSGAGSVTPDFEISSSTPAQIILPGGSAQFSLTVTAQNGATIPAVNLAATGLPPGATATFSHSAVTPGSTSATSTLTIKTTTSSAAVTGSAWPLATPTLALVGFFFIPAKRRRRWAALGVLMIVSLGALIALSGCGGSSLPPAKSYTVTITGTIGAVQQTTTVQLTVQ